MSDNPFHRDSVKFFSDFTCSTDNLHLILLLHFFFDNRWYNEDTFTCLAKNFKQGGVFKLTNYRRLNTDSFKPSVKYPPQ